MGIENTAKHLALARAQLKKLRTESEPGAFFVVFDRNSKGALLHIDLLAPPSRFKNPRVIWQRLQQAKALGSEAYAGFFENPKLVSIAGGVSYEEDGKTVCFELKVGKATAADLKAALRFFRFISDYTIKGGAEAAEETEPAVSPKERLGQARTLLGSEGPDGPAVAARLYAGGGSVDDLLELIGGLEDALASGDLDDAARAATSSALRALKAARDQLDAWQPESQGGPLGLAAGLAELVKLADIDAAAEELIADHVREARAQWAQALTDIQGALAELAGQATEAASGLEADQDPDGLAALGSADAVMSLLLEDMPESVRALLANQGDQVALNAKVIDTIIVDIGSHRAAMPSPLVALTDAHLGLGLGTRLEAAFGAVLGTFQRLRAHIL